MSPRFRDGLQEGFRAFLPLSVGLIPWALVTGLTMAGVGFTPLQAMGMNVIVFAGTAQLGTLPLIAANLIAGGLLAFAFAMLEVSDSIILAQKAAYFPITKAIYELFQLLGDGRYLASALGTWAMAFLALTIVALGVLLGRKAGTLFRG